MTTAISARVRFGFGMKRCTLHSSHRSSPFAAVRFPLGGPFHFFGQPFSSVYLNNNGLLSFDTPVATCTNETFPIPSVNIIAA